MYVSWEMKTKKIPWKIQWIWLISRFYIPHVLKLFMGCMNLGIIGYHYLFEKSPSKRHCMVSYRMKRENQISKPYELVKLPEKNEFVKLSEY